MSPVLSFTAEEIWQYMPKEAKYKTAASVHLLDWPQIDPVFAQLNLPEQDSIEAKLDLIISLIPDVAKALESRRCEGLIGSSFDAKINLLTNNEIRYNYLTAFKQDLCEIFKVSQVEVKKGEFTGADLISSPVCPEISIKVVKAEGDKCQRCWNYSFSVGENKEHPFICQNCLEAIGGK